MAVPFAIPDGEIINLIRTVIFLLSQTRIERIEENHHLQDCMEELVSLLIVELERRSRFTDYDNHLTRTLHLLRQSLQFYAPNHTISTQSSPNSRAPRSRTISESSLCDDAKIKNHVDDASTTEECGQVGLVLPAYGDYETSIIFKEKYGRDKCFTQEETLLSRLVPRVTRTFWTAVPLICVVGWHLFQTSYYM